MLKSATVPLRKLRLVSFLHLAEVEASLVFHFRPGALSRQETPSSKATDYQRGIGGSYQIPRSISLDRDEESIIFDDIIGSFSIFADLPARSGCPS